MQHLYLEVMYNEDFQITEQKCKQSSMCFHFHVSTIRAHLGAPGYLEVAPDVSVQATPRFCANSHQE